MTNFNLLQPTFRTLKVQFDSRIVDNIINCTNDTASHILYQLKMVLEKVNNPADVIINSKAGKYNTITPLMRINPPIPQYATMEQKFFDQRLNNLNRSQKAVNLDYHLKKFEDFKVQQDGIIAKEKIIEEEKEKQLKEQMRKIELNKLQRNMAFQEDWNEKGQEQWKKNQEITRQRVEADRQFQLKMRNREESKRLQIKELTKHETNKDIELFEETLKKKGLGIPEEDEDGNIIKKEHKNTVSATATMKRIKEKSQVNEFLRKERDKRRRKMIVDQAKLQRDIEVRKREELVLKKLEQQSRQEKEIEYEIWRAYQCKQIIVEDRYLRDEKYKQKNEVNVINAKYKEEELLKIIREENDKDILSKLHRQKEIEISEKQKNRKTVYDKCRSMIENLVELANICYEQQQQQDSEEIDTHFLNDQIKLFIEDKPLLKEKEFRHYSTIQNLQIQESSQTESKDFLALQELKDFLEGFGDWVPQHHFDYQVEDPLNNDEKYIPNTPQNNYILGDLIVNLMKEYYKDEIEESQRQNINHFDWLPIKIAILGYQFSGKKTLANCISRKYGVKLLSVELLMNELLEKYQNHKKLVQQQIRDEKIRSSKSNTRMAAGRQSSSNTPVMDNNENNRTSSQNNIQKQPSQNEQNINSLPEIDEESIELAQQIEEYLYSGRDLPDELYVKLILKQFKQIHPEVIEEDFLKQLAEKNFPTESETQIRIPLNNDNQMAPSKEDNFRKALVNRQHKYTNGVVLLDFPHTYEQAKLLEKELSKFIPKDEIIKTEFENQVERASLIVKPTKIDLKPRTLIQPGIDLVFYVDIDKRESLRRALGRRYDPLTKQNFHLDDNAPPVDNAPLIERLEQIREYGTSELAIVDKNCELDNNFLQLKEWYSLFGNKYEIRTPIQSGDQNLEQQNDEEQLEGEEEYQEHNEENQEEGAEQINEQGDEQKLSEQAEQANEEQNKEDHQNSQIVEKKPQFNIEEAELVVWQEVNGTNKIDEVFYQADKIIDQILIAKEQKYEAIQNKLNSIEEKKKQDEEVARIKQENEGKWLFSTREEILQDLQSFSANIKINPQALKNLVAVWKNTQDLYINTCQKAFFFLNEQKQVVLLRFHDIQKRFLELVQRNDQKFMLMRQFQEDYNKFVEQNTDMCEEDSTKEELHQRVEDLHDQLYDLIESKRDEASEERNQIIKSGWIEKEMEKLMFLIQQLLQAELSRSFSCQQIISDYYALISASELPEIPEYYKNDIVQNQDTLPPIEENNTFPRLEKLVELTFKLYQGEEEIEEKPGAKKGAVKAPPKKDDKKVVKKGGKNAVEEVEEKKELTPLEKEQKEALNVEKAIFRYRVQVIKDFALRKLKQMRAQSQMLYGKLQDWIDYTFKVENDAVNEMDKIFRIYIEEEKKIQKEIQLNYVDIVISHQTLNFLTPPPIILPAKEIIFENKFTISQLYIIIEELRSITNENNLIESRSLLQLLTRKTINKLSKCDLPETWKNNTIKNYQKLILNLDPQEQGYINSKDFCTYICLSGSTIPTHAEEENYFQNLKNNAGGEDMIEKGAFISTDAWFDPIESCKLEINTNLFDRPRYIKELIFYIHKDQEMDYIDINTYMHSLSAAAYLQNREADSVLTYTDLLLS